MGLFSKIYVVSMVILILLLSWTLWEALVVNDIHEGILVRIDCQSGPGTAAGWAIFNSSGQTLFVIVTDLGMCATLTLHIGETLVYWTNGWNQMRTWEAKP